MSNHSFLSWLHTEVTSARCALLALYEQKDKLQYIDGPQLEQEYMDKIGSFEETVIKEEIECELLQKKQQLIQATLNRREPVDEAAIDAEIDRQRQELFKEAAGPTASLEYANLTDEQSDELQELYRDIVKNFHPQMHPELTLAHEELFKKAQDAYRRRDLNALKLIHETMTSSQGDDISWDLLFELLAGTKIEEPAENEKAFDTKRDYGTDYDLASLIYDAFEPTAEEIVVREEWERYKQLIANVMNDMEKVRLRFPHNAAEMLSVPEKVDAYKADLTRRLQNAQTECEHRKNKIRLMMERVVNHE